MTVKELVDAGRLYNIVTIYEVDEHINLKFIGEFATGNDNNASEVLKLNASSLTEKIKNKEVYTFSVIKDYVDDFEYLTVTIKK